MSVWERQYRDAVAGIQSPGSLDEKILQQARRFKRPKGSNRWLSKATSSCAAMAVIALLAHPAQYLGALTPDLRPASDTQQSPLANWRQRPAPTEAADPWFDLRSQVGAGSFVELCSQWRRQQSGAARDTLPRDLEDSARAHCRLLP